MERLYLDHAATTPLLPAAREAMAQALGVWANPSSPHQEGRRARAMLEDARRRIAARLGLKGRLIFTSGASEALALALGRARAGTRLVSAVEHDAVLRAAPDAVRLPVDRLGRIDLAALERALGHAGKRPLVAVQHVNNETGVIQPIAEVAALVHQAGGILLCDCAQSAGKLPLPEADMIAVSAHKLGGPPGIGVLAIADDRLIDPMGGQEGGYRGGTENVPAAAGFAAAVEAWPDRLADWERLRARLEAGIKAAGGEIVAGEAERLPGIVAVRMAGVPAATQLMHFDLAGIAVSAGAACASGSMKPSHVLGAMGWSEDAAREVIRLSFGPETQAVDIDRFLAAWRDLAERSGAAAA